MSPAAKVGLFLGGVAVLVCGVGGFALFRFGSQWWDFPNAAAELPEQERRARELGVPLELRQLRPDPPVPAAQNAAPEVLALTKAHDDRRLRPLRTEVNRLLDASDRVGAEREHRKAAEFLVIAERVTQKPRLDLNKNWNEGPTVLLPEFAPMRSAAQLLALRAELRVARNDWDGAVADLQRVRRLADLAGDEGSLIASLVQIAIRSIEIRTVQRLATEAGRPAQIARLQRFLASPKRPPSLKRALEFEAFVSVATLRNLDKYGGSRRFMQAMEGIDAGGSRFPTPDPKSLRTEGLPPGVNERAFLARQLSFWADLWPLVQRADEDPRAFAEEYDRRMLAMESKSGLSWTLSRILNPVFGEAANAFMRLEASERATAGLLAAMRFRLERGRFPNSLAEAGFRAEDPFDSKPLRYLATRDTVRVYSVGQNGQDDGGKSPRELGASSGNQAQGDLVAAFPPPARANP